MDNKTRGKKSIHSAKKAICLSELHLGVCLTWHIACMGPVEVWSLQHWHFAFCVSESLGCCLILLPTWQYQLSMPNLYLYPTLLYWGHPSALQKRGEMAVGVNSAVNKLIRRFLTLCAVKHYIFNTILIQTTWGWRRGDAWLWKWIFLVQELKVVVFNFFSTQIL